MPAATRRIRHVLCYPVAVSDQDRQSRAEERARRISLRVTDLDDETETDPVFGAEAVALSGKLSIESWALAGLPAPRYERSEIPCRFVPWPPPT